MRANQKRSIGFIFLILFFGVICGSILSQFIGAFFPAGVVKDFFLTSNSIGWGINPNNWIDLFIIRIKNDAKMNRDDLIQFLSDQGIGTSVHYVPLHRQPYWRNKYNLTKNMFPAADQAYLSMISIPLYTAMTDEQQDRVIKALHDALG